MKIKFSSIVDCRFPVTAFTLIELLVVIAVIGVLAGFTIPVIHSVKVHQYEAHATAEMNQLETAIQSYKEARGFYPPGNTFADGTVNPLTNQLYYELEGTTLDAPGKTYTTLDGADSIDINNFSAAGLNIGGFVNSARAGGDENSRSAKNFIHDLKPGQTETLNGLMKIFTTSVGGPDGTYPLGKSSLNPWRYIYPGVNNPNGYDLWIQLKIGSKTNLICNWSTRPQINSPLP